MHIGIGNDHVAYDLKLEIKDHLESLGHAVTDFGHDGTDRTDYPVYGRAVAQAVAAGSVLAEQLRVACGSPEWSGVGQKHRPLAATV